MKTLAMPSVLGIAGLVVLLPCLAQAKPAPSSDAEDSPLFAASRQSTFAEMARRDQALPGTAGALDPGTILVVEGTKWRTVPADRRLDRPHPLDVTTDVTCSTIQCPTAASATCRTCVSYPTCSATATCTSDATCNGTCTFYPTCSGSGQATCWGATCVGNTCHAPTCDYLYPTCVAMTCQAQLTCQGTCIPAQCAPSFNEVRVPRPGEIEMSFNSSGYLRYALQYCTNLVSGQWTDVSSQPGNGGLMTLSHTNNAPFACYRLLVQYPSP